MPQLLNNESATGKPAQWGGGRGLFIAVASWTGGGTVQLQYMGPDNATWVNVGAALGANGMQNFELPPGLLRAAVSIATAAYAQAEQTKG
ncbi:MAG: hypothetical protein J7598_03540 [Mitsuaria chitosanitabida]|uniref:hypothetical protein n=1 Tax=Roseateles chitosanitabidus TaxID=65048 RepID=UPI001B18245F|nr:hypothetical protein [Roseateles chitosanitabidus]MBO9685663.1 hypothetical protein [Roseateles chitosanitabidus]